MFSRSLFARSVSVSRSAFSRSMFSRSAFSRCVFSRHPTFMSEPFIEKHAISTELCNVNREKHKLKSHRVK